MQRRLGGRLGTAVLVLAGIMAVGPVFADPIPGTVLIYSNLGPGGSFGTLGWAIGPPPPSPLVAAKWWANPSRPRAGCNSRMRSWLCLVLSERAPRSTWRVIMAASLEPSSILW